MTTANPRASQGGLAAVAELERDGGERRSPILRAALAGDAAGLSMFPPRQDGSKRPDTDTWTAYHTPDPVTGAIKRETPATLPSFYRNGRTGVGAFMGAVSANTELVDFDDYEVYNRFLQLCEAAGLGDVVQRIRHGYEESTPRGGRHWLVRCEEITGSLKLAQRPDPTADNPRGRKALIETKGEGGYAILAPSNGRVHETGGGYHLLSGGFESIATITADERRELFAVARSLDELPANTRVEHQKSAVGSAGDRPGDLFNQRATWAQVLEPHGWKRVYQRNGIGYWRRPGKSFGISATTNATGRDTLIVFSTSTPFEIAPNSYDQFGAYAVLNHGGDLVAAAHDLASRGYRAEDTTITFSRGSPPATLPVLDGPWPALQPLPALPCMPTLPPTMVPQALRPWLVDVAARACIPLEFVAIPAIIALGTVIGRSVCIRPWHFDDYAVVPNLWGGIVARPGLMKSFAIAQALLPLKRLAAEAQEQFERDRLTAEAKRTRIESEISVLKQRMAAAVKPRKGNEESERIDDLQAALAGKLGELVEATVNERRYMTQDATVEKLGELLNENPRGILMSRDELAGWLHTLDKEGHQGDREFYLEAWNGDGGFTFDRIGRGTVHIDAVTISLCGGVQPGKLQRYIRGALGDDEGADGLLQRLQLLVWPDELPDWKPPRQWPDSEAKNHAFAIFRFLDTLDPQAIRAEIEDGAIPYLRFDVGAQAVANAWRDEIERRLRSDELKETPAFEAHIAKYRSLFPSLALVFHLVAIADGEAPGPVSQTATRLAAAWCDYLEWHARKLYAAELNPGLDAARELASKIEASAVLDAQTIRDIYRPQWTGLTTPERVYAALEVLTGVGWVRVESVVTEGRPSEILRLHPGLRQEHHD